tara:strand:- start:13302 stop:13730 length:429 start_codon:yes stop_codon:yes gene_type:complete
MFDAITRHAFQIICCYVIATIAATFGALLVLPLAAIAFPLVIAVCGTLMLVVVPIAYPIVLLARGYFPQRYKLVPISMANGVFLGLPLLHIALKARDGDISLTGILHAVPTAIMSPMIIPAAAAAGAIAWFLSRPDIDYSGS